MLKEKYDSPIAAIEEKEKTIIEWRQGGTIGMHKGGYSPLCEGLDEVPSESRLLPKLRRPLLTVAYHAGAMAKYVHGLDHKFARLTKT